jgi:hypothetical protein
MPDGHGGYVFNPNGSGVQGVHQMLFGMMLLTRCR